MTETTYGTSCDNKECAHVANGACTGYFYQCDYLNDKEKPVADVAHQPHYEGLAVQPIELMLHSFTRDEMIGYLRGNILKYAMRAGRKTGTDDVAKMEQYRRWLNEYVLTGGIAQFAKVKA